MVEDASGFRGAPDEFIEPGDEDELRRAIDRAREAQMPVTIAGGLTGLAGGAIPAGGMLISLRAFRKLDLAQGSARAGAGLALADLHAAARRTGQLYPPDPTETLASIGGTIACNASGSRSFRFGATRAWIDSLRAVFIDGSVRTFDRGELIDFEVPSIAIPHSKHSAGYPLRPGMEWIDLLTGSEGTLAIVTEATVGLRPAPKSLLTGVVFFGDDEAAADAVDAWRGIDRLQMLEYLDRASLSLMGHNGAAAVIVEQEDGDAEEWVERLVKARALIDDSWFGDTAADRERFRRFRHALPEAVNERVRRNGFMKLGSDYSVPVSRSREMLAVYRRVLDAEFPGKTVLFGHAGQAHLHANILPEDQSEFQRGQAVMLELARDAVALGGSVAAEHGLGKRKKHLLALQYSAQDIGAMECVKTRFDPDWLLGRGNLFR